MKYLPDKFMILILILFPVHLRAQDEIPDATVRERIQCIQTMLEQDRKNTNIWWYGWLGGYTAATAGQGAVFLMSNDTGTKQDMAVGAATTILAAAGQLITPLHPGRKADVLLRIPESTPEERRIKLHTAEDYLKKIAITEKNGRSWKNHALYGAVNMGSGLITWVGFKRSVWAGIGNFAMNTLVSEIQIWTQPTRSWKNYQSYCRKYQSEIIPVAHKPRPGFYVCASPGGLGLRVVF
ncbi:MAG: hypothetical protein NTV01_05140 [Bacteroidia bacterium]|nr:hypothetical protein [Bacteroidia bacterium]